MSKEMFLKLNTIDRVKRFVEKANEFECDIDAIRGRYTLDAKSTLGLLSVSLLEPIQIIIRTEDEEEIKRFNEMMEEFI